MPTRREFLTGTALGASTLLFPGIARACHRRRRCCVRVTSNNPPNCAFPQALYGSSDGIYWYHCLVDNNGVPCPTMNVSTYLYFTAAQMPWPCFVGCPIDMSGSTRECCADGCAAAGEPLPDLKMDWNVTQRGAPNYIRDADTFDWSSSTGTVTRVNPDLKIYYKSSSTDYYAKLFDLQIVYWGGVLRPWWVTASLHCGHQVDKSTIHNLADYDDWTSLVQHGDGHHHRIKHKTQGNIFHVATKD
jgi:hypothetical protein